MKTVLLIVTVTLLGLASANPGAAADLPAPELTLTGEAEVSGSTELSLGTKAHPAKFRGWDYLAARLSGDVQVRKEDIAEIYGDRRMPRFGRVPFSVAPRESHVWYEPFMREPKLLLAQGFLKQHRNAFNEAERRFGVSRFAIAAILLVETQYGKATGAHTVIVRLSRVASVGDPENVRWNFQEQRKKDSSVTLKQVRDRALYLEQTFYPEIPALMQIARERGVDIFGIRGSVAGAFGLPQFLPSSYLRFGVDGNGDSIVSLFAVPDAIHSTAHYLSLMGWRPDASSDDQRKAVWHYNHSDAYVDTVIAIAYELKRRASKGGI